MSEEDGPIKSDAILDCTGLVCPMPILQTSKKIAQLEVGQVLEMISTDPGSQPDLQNWVRQTRHELLLVQSLENGAFRFLIRKTHP
ncbi:MAG: sulfurtransferase TusA family protein [Acidobacteria bacterium]|nr:sulfurtransferase TusA family protein [Acidobacteriota bacterium]